MRSVLAPRREARPAEQPPGRGRRHGFLAAMAGPALIVAMVLFAMRGFVFQDRLTNQHPDILAFWLPHFCFLGHSLASGHLPLWNPYQMAGMPAAADPQSGWLNAPAMALFGTLSCGSALRTLIVFQPLLAGLGLYWFLRRERLHRAAATVGGLSLGMLMATSTVALSLPFAGTLAWTTIVLVGASGYLAAGRTLHRLGWLALGAFAWGQVAGAHMSHGLAMATLALVCYLAARSVRNVRAGEVSGRQATLLVLGFLAFLPLANLAVFIPRVALLPRTSLRHGYAAVGGAVARIAGIQPVPLMPFGVWSGWPLAVGSAPGAYAGAVVLLSVPAALRTFGKRYLVAAFASAGIATYVLTLNLFVHAGWFRALVLHLPFGDVYLHNPGRLRYLMFLIVPVIGALGVQGFIERPVARRQALRWLAAGLGLFLVVPILFGAHPIRFLLLGVATVAAVPVLVAVARGRRWAAAGVVGVLAAELLVSAVASQAYHGSEVRLGLEHGGTASPGPLRYPEVRVRTYMHAGPIAQALEGQPGRYLTWAPPAAYYIKGYLDTQRGDTWPALENGRGMLFDLHDVLGYDPVQLTRYWSYIRATTVAKDPLAQIYYNASVIQRPAQRDVRLFGIRWLIAPTGIPLPVRGTPVVREGRYTLYRLAGSEPLVSVVRRWSVNPRGSAALRRILEPGFDPALQAIIPVDPGLTPRRGPPGRATITEHSPEDLRIDVHTGGPSLVVVRATFDPGWEATVDGQPANVLAADYFLQAVAVPAGHHVVRLFYRDSRIGQGLMASGVVWSTLGLLAVAAMFTERRRRRHQHGGDALIAEPVAADGDGERRV